MLHKILGLRTSQDFALLFAPLDLSLIISHRDVLLYVQLHSYTMVILQLTNVLPDVLHIHNTMLIILPKHVWLYALVRLSVRLLREYARILRTAQMDISPIISQSFAY